MIDRLVNVDCHDAYFILKNCLSIPKLLYFLRTAPLFNCKKLKNFDLLLKDAVEKLLNIDMDNNRWVQASLPPKFGGLGIRSVENISAAAFLFLSRQDVLRFHSLIF